LAGEPIQLVDGGHQRRSFTFIEDGIECLMRIIENRDNRASGGIFNIGNPDNDLSVRELAEKLIALVAEYPEFRSRAEGCRIVETTSDTYYGKGYQDMLNRVPSIRNARERLGWAPRTGIDEALRKTLDFYLVEQKEKTGHLL
ncbi:MAG TPA: NAD-dependent epimerase/dehydratase family protein, partial [Geobacteraceae bacterium]